MRHCCAPSEGNRSGRVARGNRASPVELTPDQREAFLLKHVEDFSYQETAVTGAPASPLRMRVVRAARLRRRLRKDHQIMPDSKDRIDDPVVAAVVAELKHGPVPRSGRDRVIGALNHDPRLIECGRGSTSVGHAIMPWWRKCVATWLGSRRLVVRRRPGQEPTGQIHPGGFRPQRVAVVRLNNWDLKDPMRRHGGPGSPPLRGRYRYASSRTIKVSADPGRPPAGDDDFGTRPPSSRW
jgi:hypothetical protein